MNLIKQIQCLFTRVKKLERKNYGQAVTSVNSQTGDVILTNIDVNALPDNYIPSWTDVSNKPVEFPPEIRTTENIVMNYLLSLPGAGPNMILSINSTGDAFEWVSQ